MPGRIFCSLLYYSSSFIDYSPLAVIESMFVSLILRVQVIRPLIYITYSSYFVITSNRLHSWLALSIVIRGAKEYILARNLRVLTSKVHHHLLNLAHCLLPRRYQIAKRSHRA